MYKMLTGIFMVSAYLFLLTGRMDSGVITALLAVGIALLDISKSIKEKEE